MWKKNNIITLLLYIIFLMFLLYFSDKTLTKIIIYAITYFSMVIYLLIHNKFKILSIPVFFTAYHAVYIGICPIFLLLSSYMSPNNYTLQSLVNSPLFLNTQCLTILSSFLIFLLTVIISEKFIFSKESIEKIKQKSKTILYSKKVCILMLGASFALLFIYVLKNFDYLFSGNLESGRIEAMSGNGVFLYGMWIGTMALALMFELLLRKKMPKIVFFPLCIIYSISILLLGFRSRLVSLCILLLLIYNKYHKIKFKKIIGIGIGLIVLVGTLGVARDILSGIENSSLLKTIVNLFQNGAININYVLNEFPSDTPYQYGNTFLINLKMILPGPDQDFTIWLKDVLDLSFDGGGVTPTILGEFYINFGYFGIFIGFILLGILVNFLERKYLYSKNAYYVSFLIWCLLSSVRGGFSNTEINFILYSIVYYLLIKIFKKSDINYIEEGEIK